MRYKSFPLVTRKAENMVIEALAPAVISVITPLAARGAKSIAESAGRIAADKAENLMHTLKKRWSDDPEATGVLKRFEEKPERYEPMLEDILSEKIESDGELAGQLRELLQEMGDSLEIVQNLGKVSGEATGLEAGELGRGRSVSVQQSADEVSGKITGAKIDKIG